MITFDQQTLKPARNDGYLPLEQYAALADGRSIALVGADGGLDWWCVPNIHSPALFDRILDAGKGGHFTIQPQGNFTVERHYRPDSNVLETTFITASGRARLTESLNSGVSGRLPWSELARRLDGVEGEISLNIHIMPGNRGDTIAPWWRHTPNGNLLHVGDLVVMLRHTEHVVVQQEDNLEIRAVCHLKAGNQALIALLASEGSPLLVPSLEEIDQRLEQSDAEWRKWTQQLQTPLATQGPYAPWVRRSALALKVLLYSPTGAIAAAGTMALPERIGGNKNYDYRHAWVRDAAYTIKALLRIGATSEPAAAFNWLRHTLASAAPVLHPCFSLYGEQLPAPHELEMRGYRDSRPVTVSNKAKEQLQLSAYGDIMETAALYTAKGHVLDPATVRLLTDLAHRCADNWRRKDSSIWELEEEQHYTMSKMGCWLALDRAARMAAEGHLLDGPNRLRWERERDRIKTWIEEHCWSDELQAYSMYAGSDDKLDAALLLVTRFGFPNPERLRKTRDAIAAHLTSGPLVYRYTGMEAEEGTFLCCAFWMVEAYAFLGDVDEARTWLDALLARVSGNLGLLNEQLSPQGAMLGNMPQGLSHLALIHAVSSLYENGFEHEEKTHGQS